jgi:hypothetical protein
MLAASLMDVWPEDTAGGPDTVRAELDRIVAWVDERSGDGTAPTEAGAASADPPAPGGPAAAQPPHDGPAPEVSTGNVLLQRRMLEALRLACLRRWEEHPSASEPAVCLRLLALLEERARQTLPRDARDFASRLTDPDGFELLLEVAHDLRSPLTSVSFLAETLRGGFSGPLTEPQRHQLGLIYSAAVAMQSVVTDIMELARHGADVVDEKPQPFALGDVFASVQRMVGPMAEVKGVDLRIEPIELDRFLGRPVTLGRILLNLVTNGLKFTDEGYVELSARRVGRDLIELSVRDTGRGVDALGQASMFDAFRKSRDRPGSFFSGSGLGLSIVRRLVGALGSELEFETREGWGTRFHFRLQLPSVPHV